MPITANTVSITTAVGEPANLYIPPPPPADLTVSAALRYLKLTPGATVSISDSAATIQKNLATLQSLNGRITAVSASSGQSSVMTVAYKDYVGDKGILDKWANNAGHQFVFTDVTAAAATTLWNNDVTSTLSIKDTAINIQNNFDALVALQAQNGDKLTAIAQTNTSGLITLNTTQYAAAQVANIFAKLNRGISSISIINANVYEVVHADGLRLGVAARVKSISIVDTTDNIDHNINLLQRVGMKIKTISQDNLGVDSTLELDATEIKNNRSVLGKIITGYQLAAQNTAASQLSAMLANRKVITIDVKDTASNISRNWDNINSIYTSINTVEISDPATSIKIKASQLALSRDLISKFQFTGEGAARTGTFKLEVTEAAANQVEELQGNKEISKFDIKDTAENIGLYLDDLIDSASENEGKLNFIKTANSAQIEMSYQIYAGLNDSFLEKINKGLYNFKLTNVTVANLEAMTDSSLTADLLFLDKTISAIEITDSAANIETSLDLLNSSGTRVKSINLTNASESLTVDAKDFVNRQRVLEKINGGYTVDIEKATAKQALTLSINSHVKSIDIEDTSTNFSGYWDQLVDINASIDQVRISGARISVTADQYEEGIALEDDLQEKIIAVGLDVEFAIKNASIEQALTLVADDTSDYIHSIEVKDTGENITNNFAELSTLLGLSDTTLIQVDPRNPLQITYDDLEDYDNVLDKISGQGYRLFVTGASVSEALNMVATTPNNPLNLNFKNASSINIAATSTEVGTNFNELLSIGKKLDSIDLANETDNITITYDQYLKGKFVLDRINDDYALELNQAPVYSASSLSNNDHVKAVNTYGSASYISKAWDSLVGLGSKVKSILNTTTYSDVSKVATSIGLSMSQWLNSSSVIGKITGQKFAIYDATVADTETILSDNAQNLVVTNIKIQDTAGTIDDAFDTNPATATSSISYLKNDKVSEIALVDSKVALDLTYAQITDATKNPVLAKIANLDFLLNVDSATVAQAFTLETNSSNPAPTYYDYISKVRSIKVTDTGSNVQTKFDTLKEITKLQAIGLSDSDTAMTFSATKILEDSSVVLFKKITLSPYYLDATSTSMTQLGQLHPLDNTVIGSVNPIIDSAVLPNLRNYYVKDTAGNISSSYDRLIAIGTNLKGLNFSDAENTLSISYDQWQASKATLAAGTFKGYDSTQTKSAYLFNLSNVKAQDAAGSVGGPAVGSVTPTASLFDDALIKSLTVSDTADQISANWTALQTEYAITGRTSKLLDLVFTDSDHLTTDSDHLTLSASQVVKTLGSATFAELLADKVDSTNSVVVRDTAANIQTYWNDLADLHGNVTANGQLISSIELIDTNKVQLTAAQQLDEGGDLVEVLEGRGYSVETIV